MTLLAGCGLATLAGVAFADPPARVGRVSDVEGQVSFLPPSQGDWVQALRNYPVTTGEAFWTGDEGRLELQVGGVQARVDSDTELDVVDLDYGETRLSIPQGSVDIRLWRVPEGGVTVSTPAGDVQLAQPGAYRIDVAAPDDSGEYPPVEVTALGDGDAGAPGPSGFVDVPAGAAALIYAGYDPQLQDAQNASIDDWARDREAQLRYDQVNWQQEPEAGYADLSNYGQFSQDPNYGEVWYPSNVAPDWAPYRFGQWSYVEPWGWTWIDDQPWGFTPFHYGRWVMVDGRWGWAPGQRVARPVYAPALVAFIGGASFAASVGGGAFGWVPLAPDEPYIPPYRVSQTYVRQVNVTSVNTTVLNTITVNNTTVVEPAHLKNAAAASAITSDALGRGAKVQQAVVHVTPQALAQAHVSPATAPPAPPRPTAATGAKGAGAGAVTTGGLHAAAPPPAKVQQLRAAVAQAPKGSTAPPPLPGVHKAAAAPVAGAAAAPIAPAAKSGREPPPKPLPPRTTTATGAGAGRAVGAGSLPPKQPLASHPSAAPSTAAAAASGASGGPPPKPLATHPSAAAPSTAVAPETGAGGGPPPRHLATHPAGAAPTAAAAPAAGAGAGPPPKKAAPITSSVEGPAATRSSTVTHPSSTVTTTTAVEKKGPPPKAASPATPTVTTTSHPPPPPPHPAKAPAVAPAQPAHPTAVVQPTTKTDTGKPPAKKPPPKAGEPDASHAQP